MSSFEEKKSANSYRLVPNVSSRKSKLSPQFADNRPEAIKQRQIQEIANNSEQTKKAAQLKLMFNSSLQSKRAAEYQEMANRHSAEASSLNTLQMYRNVRNRDFGTTIQSNGGAYLLEGIDSSYIYARADAPTPRYCKQIGEYSVNGVQYKEYTPAHQFRADCLQSAEEIMHNKEINSAGVYSREYYKENNFGDTSSKNWKAANSTDEDERDTQVAPNIGKAFAIVEPKARNLGNGVFCQYHAAAVVAEDGGDKITLEIFGDPDEGRRNVDGKFKIYDTDPKSGQTFHEAWTQTFPNGITIELERTGRPR